MIEKQPDISLGIGGKNVPIGTHICLVYNSQRERVDSFMKFVLSGLRGKERLACFTEGISCQQMDEFLSINGISLEKQRLENTVILKETREVYFEKGAFDPDHMLRTLDHFYRESFQLGFSASRMIGDMIPEVMHIPGGERLYEYESRVSIFLRDHPVTTMCLYDANLFDGATIMNVLRVHPLLIVDGMILSNPFYITPEDYLKSIK